MTAARLTFPSAALTALCAVAASIATSACAQKEPAAPADVAFDIEFPSVAAAIALDNVKLYIFDGALGCNDLVRKRQTDQALPAALVERPVTPCDFQKGTVVDFELELKSTFTVLAVGQAGGVDLLVGCAIQTDFGATRALPVSLTYVDATKKIPDTTCARLSDKCNGACQR